MPAIEKAGRRTKYPSAVAALAFICLLLASGAPSMGAPGGSHQISRASSVPTGRAPEPAAATLSGMGLFSIGWYLRLRSRRRFHSELVAQAETEGFVVFEPQGESLWRVLRERAYLGTKRAIDIAGASVLLLLLSPVLALLALVIYLDSPGPTFYRQERLGVGRRKFKLIKFRSMCVNADQVLKQNPELMKEFEGIFKLKNDPRITRVGRFLRRTSLDELPQLINVLLGDISLVGPRPIVEAECEKYWPFEERLFSVKPGVTGLWQISGRNDISYEERVRLDMRYIAERSAVKDLVILASTLPALLKRDNGAY